MQWKSFPETIPDVPDQALLASTYSKEGLSELDRYHAKFGDVGVKSLKKALPHLKIPNKYRCTFCIEGKVHKFGHPKCPVEDRTQYLPDHLQLG